MRIELVSEHANPMSAVGGEDAGGQNVHVAALAAGLVRRGHEVVVSTRRDDPRTPRTVRTRDGYVVEHVPAGPPTEVPKDELWPHVGEMAAHLRERWSVEPPDVVHAHFWMSGVAATDAAAAVGLPVVQTFHALGTVKRRHQGVRDTSPARRIAVEAALGRSVNRVIATCRDEVGELTAMGVDPAQVAVVPCGVDTELFTPGSASTTGRRPRLLVVGRLVERKGVGDVVTALADLPGVDLLVAGGPTREGLVVDPEAVRLRELAEANGTAGRLHLLGSVARRDVPDLLRSVDIVVAVPWYEPFGIVPLEAMACGRPVVGSAVGGLLDTIVPGVCGDLVPPRRPDLLAGALRALLADPQRRAAYSRAGVRRVRARYRWERVCAETESVYADVLAHYRHRTTVEVLR